MLLSAFSSAVLCSSALKNSIEPAASNVDLRSQHLDLFQRNEVSFSDSRATFLDALPVRFAGQVRLPERPRSTLSRPSGIDRAASLLRVKVDAVSVGVFGQRYPPSNGASIHQPNFSDWLIEKISDRLNLVLFHPDVTWGAGAAVAALSTLKRKPVPIPRPLLRRRIVPLINRLVVRCRAHRFCPISKTAAVSRTRSFAVKSF